MLKVIFLDFSKALEILGRSACLNPVFSRKNNVLALFVFLLFCLFVFVTEHLLFSICSKMF